MYFVRFKCHCAAVKALQRKQKTLWETCTHTQKDRHARFEGGGPGRSRRATRRGVCSQLAFRPFRRNSALPRPAVANEA
jgi:hypothetical protein